MKKIIIMVLAGLLLIGGAIGGTLYFTGAFSDKPEVEEDLDSEEKSEEDESEEEGGEDADGKKKKKVKKNKKGDPLETFYYHIQPEFVVNFGAKSKPKYLMLEISVSTYEEEVTNKLDTHSPELRNNLLLMLSTKTSEELSTLEGKNELRAATLEIISELIEKHSINGEAVDVFFTRFVMQ